MFTVDIETTTGTVGVQTTENKGLSPEYWTDRIVERLVSISDTADPMVKAQAEAFRDSIQQLILHYLKQAVASDRSTVAGLLEKQGHKDMAEIIKAVMAISQAMCTSFKVELMTGTHNFTNSSGNAFKLALYTSSATLGAATTAFSATNEVSGTGYTSGGGALTNVTPTSSGTTAFTDFADLTFSSSTITANGALIYNSTNSNKAVCVLAFGGDKSSTNGDFTIQFPTPDASNAIIRIA